MNYVKVYTKTYRDNSARYIELPSLLIEQDGETQIFEQLLRYQIKYNHKSRTWHNKLIQAVGLLFDYMNANPNNYVSAKDFFITSSYMYRDLPYPEPPSTSCNAILPPLYTTDCQVMNLESVEKNNCKRLWFLFRCTGIRILTYP